MLRAPLLPLALLCIGTVAATAACAASPEVDLATAEDFVQATDGDDAEAAEAKMPPPTHGDGAPASEGSDSSKAGSDDGADTASCAATTSCTSPTILDEMKGDTTGDVQTATGTGSKWLRVRMIESDTGGIFGQAMKLAATLTSPAGSNYDLYFYLAGDESAQPSCSAATQASATTSATEASTLTWGETTFFNNEKDHRWVTIEVRHVSGSCASPWTLELRGGG